MRAFGSIKRTPFPASGVAIAITFILFTLKNAHLSICNKLNLAKKLVDSRGIPEHQEYTFKISTMQTVPESNCQPPLSLGPRLSGKTQDALGSLCKNSARGLRNVLNLFVGDAERWEWTFLIAGITAIAVMDLSRERMLMWIASHLFIYVGMSVALHRYFSHKSFKTSRVFQTVLAMWGSFSLQGGCLFWAALHRHHHGHCDEDSDLHSPQPGSLRSFYWSHVGWLSQPGIMFIWERSRLIDDLLKYK
ncbi:MAG: hypothetical protein ACRERV_06755, partial [Methylococcales bacterium]